MGLLGFIFMAYSVTMSITALYFIMLAIERSKELGTLKPYSYKAMAVAAFGPSAGTMVDCIIMCYTGFSLVAYMVLIIDFFQPPLRYFFGPGVWETAPFILLCGGLAIFGLCCLPSVEALKYSSLLGNLAIFYTVMLVIYEWYSNDMAVSEDVVPFRFGPGALRVVGIFTAAFNMHYNMPVYYEGMQPYSPASMLSIVFSVFAMVLVFYIPISLCGYFNFGSSIQSNILRNFGDDTRFLVCRLGLGIMMICSYPLVQVSTRSALGRLVYGDSQELSYEHKVKLSMVILPVTVVVAYVMPSFGVVLAYNGAIFGTLQQLIFPSLAFYFISQKAGIKGCSSTIALVVATLGVVVACIGTGAQTYVLMTGQ
uniref:Amino acid transporter transmembrane domain-containing protein n=1 Tax=Eutreptiella gymnastica TaxID=73025 RepID=A0A7S4D2E2_9EUGL